MKESPIPLHETSFLNVSLTSFAEMSGLATGRINPTSSASEASYNRIPPEIVFVVTGGFHNTSPPFFN
jgi:hypothetical protein